MALVMLINIYAVVARHHDVAVVCDDIADDVVDLVTCYTDDDVGGACANGARDFDDDGDDVGGEVLLMSIVIMLRMLMATSMMTLMIMLTIPMVSSRWQWCWSR